VNDLNRSKFVRYRARETLDDNEWKADLHALGELHSHASGLRIEECSRFIAPGPRDTQRFALAIT
jgi:hypothetical protein